MIYSPSAFSGRPVIVCVQLFAAVRVTVLLVGVPFARRATVMLSGRMPSWLSASSDLGYRRAGLTWGVAVGDVVIIINSCCITR